MSKDLANTPYGPYQNAPRGVWGRFRGAMVLVLVWAFLGVAMTAFIAFVLATFRIGVLNYSHRAGQFFGRIVFRLAGLDLRVHGREHVAGRKPRIIAINHASQLDFFTMAQVLPPAPTAIAKKEIVFIPFIGWGVFAVRSLFVDRGNARQARASLMRAVERMKDYGATVLISPEGTRSRDGSLGPFKMGLFHLALASRAPIVPCLIRGAKECQPMGQLVPDPGLIEVTYLPEIATDDFTEENLHEKRDALRSLFLRELSESTSARR